MPSCVWQLLKAPSTHDNRRLDVFITPIVVCTIRRSKEQHEDQHVKDWQSYENAHMESFFKTLKYEEVHLSNYETYEDVLGQLPHFIEEVYNKKRLHSAPGILIPRGI